MVWPLQTYASAVIFAPSRSIMGELLRSEKPNWVALDDKIREGHWSAWAQTLDLSDAEPEVVGPVDFSPDGAWLAAALKGNYNGKTVQKVRVWDMATGNSVWTLKNASSRVAFPPNHSLLGTITSPGEVRFWDLAKGVWKDRIIYGLNTAGAAFSPNGVWLAAADGNRICVQDWAEGRCTSWFRHESTSCPFSLAYSANGARLASAHTKEVRVWNLQSRSLLQCINMADTNLIAFSMDTASDKLILTSNESLAIWILETGELINEGAFPSEVGAVTISANGIRVALVQDGLIMTGDKAQLRMQRIRDDNQHVRSLVLSPNFNQIASIGAFGLRLYWASTVSNDFCNVVPR